MGSGDGLKFNIWTGEVSEIKDEDRDENNYLIGANFFLEDHQHPVYDYNGRYIGMMYEGTFLSNDVIDSLFYAQYGTDEVVQKKPVLGDRQIYVIIWYYDGVEDGIIVTMDKEIANKHVNEFLDIHGFSSMEEYEQKKGGSDKEDLSFYMTVLTE